MSVRHSSSSSSAASTDGGQSPASNAGVGVLPNGQTPKKLPNRGSNGEEVNDEPSVFLVRCDAAYCTKLRPSSLNCADVRHQIWSISGPTSTWKALMENKQLWHKALTSENNISRHQQELYLSSSLSLLTYWNSWLIKFKGVVNCNATWRWHGNCD